MNTSSATPTPFHKILIANRGEIALRIMRTARAMGYRTVAVYSTVDAQERHVREADEAYCIGAAPSYLDIAAILEAAAASGADAIHPGYGFLAENEDFAQACVSAGLVFVGPSPRAIAAMGNKAQAKQIMQEAGVPCVPGFQGDKGDDALLATEAARIGFPVMIKATAGGGGRGMRLVSGSDEFLALLRSARSEALAAFGSDQVILERAILEPRHVEIQVLADRHGAAIHLGERDCSVQRRHQKVIEEAPSPAVTEALRQQMGEISVTAAKAIGYEGAGTLEFLLDADGQFYFMEMNTRLQVEHPVTEFVTGLDVVEQQLRIAAGEPLAMRQADVTFSGHAIEVRLCAEDPANDFLPQSGTMALWSAPADTRVEHALLPGSSISPFYDSMIAKLVTHGATRDEARRKMASALHELVAVGVRTNQEFLRSCLMHEEFASGRATTGFIGRHRDALLARPQDEQDALAAIGAVLLALVRDSSDAAPVQARLLRSVPLVFDMDDRALAATVTHAVGDSWLVNLGGGDVPVRLQLVAPGYARAAHRGVEVPVHWCRSEGALQLQVRQRSITLVDRSRLAAKRTETREADGKLRALVNGKVIAVMVGVGDEVQPGQPLFTIEAMKIEHVHASAMAGRVLAIHARTGEQVRARMLLAEVA